MGERKFNCNKNKNSYKNGCRCDDCRRANAEYARDAKRRQRAPGWVAPRRVDPAETRQHLEWLYSHGVGVVAVHRASGVDMNTIIDVRKGKKSYLQPATAARLLSVGLHRTPSVDMVRDRIKALLNAGWTGRDVAKAAGVSEYTIYEISNHRHRNVWPRTAERVLALSATSPPPSR